MRLAAAASRSDRGMRSTMVPRSSSATLFTKSSVVRRWAITRPVRPRRSCARAPRTSASVAGSMRAAGSSRITRLGSRNRMRAIATSCRSPEDSSRPPGPMTVATPSPRPRSQVPAARRWKAPATAAADTASSNRATLSRRLPGMIPVSCGSMATRCRRCRLPSSRTDTPPRRTLPSCSSIHPGQKAGDGRLAAAGTAHQSQHRPRGQLEVGIPQHRGTVDVGKAYAVELDRAGPRRQASGAVECGVRLRQQFVDADEGGLCLLELLQLRAQRGQRPPDQLAVAVDQPHGAEGQQPGPMQPGRHAQPQRHPADEQQRVDQGQRVTGDLGGDLARQPHRARTRSKLART